ncbi:MAG: fumarate hydratase [Planctomycetota bacterium]|jgi:fumarate hydratase subunit alpha
MSASRIAEAVKHLALDAAFALDGRTLDALTDAHARETSPLGRDILAEIIENARIAGKERRPLCQDTGLVIVWIELGEEVRVDGSIEEAVNSGVREAWREGPLRSAVVRDPLDRKNTGDNTPAFVHVDRVKGDRLRVHFLAKGGGSENQSRSTVLTPAGGRAGVVGYVVDAVREGAAFACPPVIVGVGVGGTADHAAWLAKRALFRSPGEPSEDTSTADIEREILEGVNASGIGPMGLGGNVTALAVAVARAPCHIASLPVAVCLNCHSYRARSAEIGT